MADKKTFKLTMRSTEVAGPGGGLQRALIIAVGPSPVKGWMPAVLATEDGGMIQKMISDQDFELAARKLVTLVEIEGERAAPILYLPNNPAA